MKDCKIVCEGKDVATISCTGEGLLIKCTDEGKEMCKAFKGSCKCE